VIGFLDTEWTSLHPTDGEVWEVALHIPDGPKEGLGIDTWVWHIRPTRLDLADHQSLRIGGYHDRFGVEAKSGAIDHFWVCNRAQFAEEFVEVTQGVQFAGLTLEGDMRRLDDIVRQAHLLPRWHYQPIDVEILAVGYLIAKAEGRDGSHAPEELRPPWTTTKIMRDLGIDPEQFAAHTAVGDLMAAKAMYDRVMTG
jgi:hypothetical protein